MPIGLQTFKFMLAGNLQQAAWWMKPMAKHLH